MNDELYASAYEEAMRRCDAVANGDQAAWTSLLREAMPRAFAAGLSERREKKFFQKFLKACRHFEGPNRP